MNEFANEILKPKRILVYRSFLARPLNNIKIKICITGLINIYPEGSKKLAIALPAVECADAKFFEISPPKESQTLIDIFQKLSHHSETLIIGR